MAFTFQGIGTTYYGERDFLEDGSYLTTRWFVFLGVPIIPLRSLRVRYLGPGNPRFRIGLSWSETYTVYGETSVNWKQVACVYSFALFIILWFLSVSWLFLWALHGTIGYSAASFLFWLILLILPAIIPHLLRRNARRRLLH
jgi:hypothetical protein